MRRAMMEAGTAACSCVSPSGCCQVTHARSAPSLAPGEAQNLPHARWSCSHHRTWTENTDQTWSCRNYTWRTYSEHVPEKCPCSVLMTGQNKDMRTTMSPWYLLLKMRDLLSSYLFFKCWTLPRQRNLPLTMMAMRVHRASHSSMLPKTKQQKNTIHKESVRRGTSISALK